MLYLLEGPVKGHITEDRKIKKAKHVAGIEPICSLLLRGALYRCATTAAPLGCLIQNSTQYVGSFPQIGLFLFLTNLY